MRHGYLGKQWRRIATRQPKNMNCNAKEGKKKYEKQRKRLKKSKETCGKSSNSPAEGSLIAS